MILEVDLEVPKERKFSDYPLAPEKFEVSRDMISDYARQVLKDNDPKFFRCSKLVSTMFPKTNYVLHYRNLKFYVEQGLKLTRIHRVLKFKEKAWLKPYIEFNTTMRAKAADDFSKNLYKSYKNSVFGKTMENLRKLANVKLITSQKELQKLTRSPLVW